MIIILIFVIIIVLFSVVTIQKCYDWLLINNCDTIKVIIFTIIVAITFEFYQTDTFYGYCLLLFLAFFTISFIALYKISSIALAKYLFLITSIIILFICYVATYCNKVFVAINILIASFCIYITLHLFKLQYNKKYYYAAYL